MTTLDADAGTFRPLFRHAVIPRGFDISLGNIFSVIFDDTYPAGEYRVFMAFMLPDALRDGRLDEEDITVLGSRSFSFAP